MVMSKTAIYIHVVFATKYRQRTIFPDGKDRLYSYSAGIIKSKDCHLCAIGGYTDHVHLLIDLHPSVALSSLVRDIKTSSVALNKKDWFLPYFDGWSDGYYAGSLSPSHKNQCEDYIRKQESHHQNRSIEDEMETMASKYGFTYHDDDLR